jgi:hypothetical protein
MATKWRRLRTRIVNSPLDGDAVEPGGSYSLASRYPCCFLSEVGRRDARRRSRPERVLPLWPRPRLWTIRTPRPSPGPDMSTLSNTSPQPSAVPRRARPSTPQDTAGNRPQALSSAPRLHARGEAADSPAAVVAGCRQYSAAVAYRGGEGGLIMRFAFYGRVSTEDQQDFGDVEEA